MEDLTRSDLYLCLSCPFAGVRENNASESFMTHSILHDHPLGALIMSPFSSSPMHANKYLARVALMVRKQQLYCGGCREFVYPPSTQHQHSAKSFSALSDRHADRENRFRRARLSACTRAKRTAYRGLVNLGNTCFMNAVLQSFAHNPLLQHFFLVDKTHDTTICQQKRSQQTPSPVCMGCELGALLSAMLPRSTVQSPRQCFSNTNNSTSSVTVLTPVIPHSLLETLWSYAPSFVGSAQQDAHEFFISLLGGLHAHTNASGFVLGATSPRFTPKGKSLCDCAVHQHFAGVLQSQVECAMCEHVSSAFDPFLDLSLSIKEPKTDGDASPLSLEMLLMQFTSDEQLRGKNQVYCRRCAKYSHAVKRLRIRTLPNVLVIQIKRLDFYRQRKIASFVSFPAKSLDLQAFTGQKPNGDVNSLPNQPELAPSYDLVAVVNHHGSSIDGGHYTSYVRLDVDQDGDISSSTICDQPPQLPRWLLFDDDQVTVVPERTVLQSQA